MLIASKESAVRACAGEEGFRSQLGAIYLYQPIVELFEVRKPFDATCKHVYDDTTTMLQLFSNVKK